jgi:hypothetical protein
MLSSRVAQAQINWQAREAALMQQVSGGERVVVDMTGAAADDDRSQFVCILGCHSSAFLYVRFTVFPSCDGGSGLSPIRLALCFVWEQGLIELSPFIGFRGSSWPAWSECSSR